MCFWLCRLIAESLLVCVQLTVGLQYLLVETEHLAILCSGLTWAVLNFEKVLNDLKFVVSPVLRGGGGVGGGGRAGAVYSSTFNVLRKAVIYVDLVEWLRYTRRLTVLIDVA
jgi:hypothetical protein